jgi:hypothetical protein
MSYGKSACDGRKSRHRQNSDFAAAFAAATSGAG